MSKADWNPEVAEVLDYLREKHSWFDKIMSAVGRLTVSKDKQIAQLTRECADWKRLAEERESAHTQGYVEGRELSKLRYKEEIELLRSTLSAVEFSNHRLGRELAQLGADLRWFRDREVWVRELASESKSTGFEIYERNHPKREGL